VRAGLVDSPISAREWVIPGEFLEYGLSLGLKERQVQDAVTDFREKVTKKATPVWLASQLCRYIEAPAERIAAKALKLAPDPEPEGPDAADRAFAAAELAL
jgi:hypothetical protein